MMGKLGHQWTFQKINEKKGEEVFREFGAYICFSYKGILFDPKKEWIIDTYHTQMNMENIMVSERC